MPAHLLLRPSRIRLHMSRSLTHSLKHTLRLRRTSIVACRRTTIFVIGRHDDLLDNGVERAARRALNTKKVPVSSMTLCFAIVAHDIDDTLQVGRHWLLRNITSTSFPCCRHALGRHDSFLADWTTIIKAGKLTETMRMNRMTAGQVLRRLARGKHVFATDGTIVLVLVLEAIVRTEHMDANAHATFVAVTKGLLTSNATKATVLTMKGLFRLCHPEVANAAMILSKLDSAMSTLVSVCI